MGDARMARMMSRMAVSRPPGVSICNTTIRLPFAWAASMPLVTYREVAGPMAPLISRTVAVPAPVAVAVPAPVAVAVGVGTCASRGGLAARTELTISPMIAVRIRPTKAAKTTLTRTQERAELAFTLLTLLPSYAERSKCQSSYLRGEPGRARCGPRVAFDGAP